MTYLILLVLVPLVTCQVTTTEDYTVTYNPGIDCLPYDGSVVPNCAEFVDPVTKQPYYHEHSNSELISFNINISKNFEFLDCSRFWECGPDGETCLFECAPCGVDNPMCNGQWALSFDVRYQYPLGPVCDWPSTINCTNGGCEDHVPRPECCSDEECANGCPGSHCSHNFQCIYNEHCECTLDADCDHFDEVCNLPPPHTPENCAYCVDAQCKGGMLTCFFPAENKHDYYFRLS